MKKTFVLGYGLICYAVFLLTFLYAVAWMGNIGVPNSIDADPRSDLGMAVIVNALLLTVFALQHSVMARPFFKKMITRYIPEPAERPTYVLASCLAMILMFWLWQPMGITIWKMDSLWLTVPAMTIYFCGWLVILAVTFLISHFDLFGLRQVWFYFRGQEYVHLKFVTPGPYKYIRHPLYVGWLMTFWATPTMTSGHLFFAIGCTIYILIAIQLEERDLENELGMDYTVYRNQVPMLIPKLGPERQMVDSGIHRF